MGASDQQVEGHEPVQYVGRCLSPWFDLMFRRQKSAWNVALTRFTVEPFLGQKEPYVWEPASCADIGKPKARHINHNELEVCQAYPDTGTSLIGVPNSTWTVLLKAARAGGLCNLRPEHNDPVWECDCEVRADPVHLPPPSTDKPSHPQEFVLGKQTRYALDSDMSCQLR